MRICIIFFCSIVIFGGCTSLTLEKEKPNKRKLSCEENAKPKSLEFLEQQYRCTSQVEEN